MRMKINTNISKLKSPSSECLSSRTCPLSLKRALFVMGAVLSLIPQTAHASCGGKACSSFSMENRSYDSSNHMGKATLVNKDQRKKIHLKGCMSVNGKCGSTGSFDVTIDPGKRQPISGLISTMLAKPYGGPAEAKDFVVDVYNAEFVEQPASVSNEPTAPGGSTTATGGKPASRNLEVENDLKDPVTVIIEHEMGGNVVNDQHDIKSGGSAVFTMTVDNDIFHVNIVRHVDMQRINCGALMRYDIPPSRQKVYVTPAEGSSPPPEHEGRADSKPCVLSQASHVEKARAPPAAGSTAGGGSAATKVVVENDLKDPVDISTLAPFGEEHLIDPRQSVTFTKSVLHKGENDKVMMEIYIQRLVGMRMLRCGVRLEYDIPSIPEVKFFVTRVPGSVWPPRAKPDGQSGEPGGESGKLPGAPSCELTRAQNFEK